MTRDIERALHDFADSASALSGIADAAATRRPSARLAGLIRRRRAFKAAGIAVVGVGTAASIAFAGLPGSVLAPTHSDDAGIIAVNHQSASATPAGTATTAKPAADAAKKAWPAPPAECATFFAEWKAWWAAKAKDHKAMPTGMPTAWPTAKPTAWPTAWPTAKPAAPANDAPKPSAACTAALKEIWAQWFKPPTIPAQCTTYFATWKDLWPQVKPTAWPTGWPVGKPTALPTDKPTAWPTGKPTVAIDPKIKAWLASMPAECKAYFPLHHRFFGTTAPKAQGSPAAPVVQPSRKGIAPAIAPSTVSKLPTRGLPTAPTGSGMTATWPSGSTPGAPGSGR